MNYAEMTDFEINKAVAVALGGVATTDYKGLAIYDMGESQPLVVSQCMHSKGDFLPCSSWADAGPVIQANSIGLIAPFAGEEPGGWTAYDPLSKDTCASHDSPLRAAMIVFLMMQEKPDA